MPVWSHDFAFSENDLAIEYFRDEERGSERFRNLPKVTQLTSGRGGNSDPFRVLCTAVCKAQDMAERRIRSLSGLEKAAVHTGSWQAEKSTGRNLGSWEGEAVFGEHSQHPAGRLQGSWRHGLLNSNSAAWTTNTFLEPVIVSVAKLGPILCDSMDCSTAGFPVLHHLLEFTQTHVLWSHRYYFLISELEEKNS